MIRWTKIMNGGCIDIRIYGEDVEDACSGNALERRQVKLYI
jgi:hypothetical protein